MGETSFRQRVKNGERVLGTFIKTPTVHVVEILGRAALAFVAIDAEHAAFDRRDVDRLVLAARGLGLPCLVRAPDHAASFAACCLDVGAEGVLFPHVRNGAQARACVWACRFTGGDRGFSPSPRAADYGLLDPQQYLCRADERTAVWCQIEDADALDQLDAIASTAGVDCLFIGRADLARSLGLATVSDVAVADAIVRISEAGRRFGVAVGIYISDPTEAVALVELGITVFVCGSDQSLLLQQARRIRAEFAPLAVHRP